MNELQLQQKARAVLTSLYQKTHISKELVMLYSSRTITRFALGILGVFLPIFFFIEFGYDIDVVIAIYLIIYGLHLLITPLSARLLSGIGTRRMMILGSMFSVLSMCALYFFPHNPAYAAVSYAVFAAVYKALYWIPYHVDFSNSLDGARRGRQLAILENVASGVLIIVPTIGGIIIAVFGFSTIFIFAIVTMVLSIVPLWFTRHAYERYSWSYIETFKHLFAWKNRTLFLAHSANGAQTIAIMLFWPIYVFLLLGERFTVLGIITSLTIVTVMMLRYFIGKLFDTWSPKKVVVIGILMATTGWVTKVFVQTPFQILIADSYHNFGRTVHAVSFDAITYEQAADNGRYVDEYTVLQEMALAVGRIVMLLLMAILISLFDIRVAFIVSALAALGMIVINKSVRVY